MRFLVPEQYHYVNSYFVDGMKTIEHFRSYIEDLVSQLGSIKQRQDAERRKLVELRDAIRSSMSTYKEVRRGAYIEMSFHINLLRYHGSFCYYIMPLRARGAVLGQRIISIL